MPEPDPKFDTSDIIGEIDALFLDYLTFDISESEWNRLQENLADIILKIKNDR